MTEKINTDSSQVVSPKRLWFGFAGSAFAWILAGLFDVTVAWQACMGGEAGSSMFTQTWVRVVLGIVTFGFIAAGTMSGLISYRNWQTLSHSSDLLSAEGRGRQEFMALFGLFVSLTLVLGMIWFFIVIFILRMCNRTY